MFLFQLLVCQVQICMYSISIYVKFDDNVLIISQLNYNIFSFVKSVLCYELSKHQGEHFHKTYGLNHRSILNNSRYYHVVGGLPANAIHDVLEGVLHYTILLTSSYLPWMNLTAGWKTLIMVTIMTVINHHQFKENAYYLMIIVLNNTVRFE